MSNFTISSPATSGDKVLFDGVSDIKAPVYPHWRDADGYVQSTVTTEPVWTQEVSDSMVWFDETVAQEAADILNRQITGADFQVEQLHREKNAPQVQQPGRSTAENECPLEGQMS